MRLQQLLYEADKFKYFTYLNGNGIPYLHNGFKEQLAYSNKDPISTLNELEIDVESKKQLFGHFGYDLKKQLHNLNSDNSDYVHFPELNFFEPEFYFDSNSITPEDNHSQSKKESSTINIKSRFNKEEYISIIQQLRQHIIEGDCYEINFCMEFYAEDVEIDPIDTYKRLNTISPMPFSALHKVKNNYLICASPERFIKKEGDQLISQPIKGTIKKGETKKENETLKQELLNSEKERAENLMIVDLVRNDLAKSSVPGTVKVEELFGIYDFSNVNQMISTVTSEKRKEISSLDSILNAFPMGSMTGAPKHKVMQLIEEYEQTKRGLYSGSIGYFDKNGDYDFNVVIRSIAYNADTGYLSFQVGGAITYDSTPEQEYDECMLKASAIMQVLG